MLRTEALNPPTSAWIDMHGLDWYLHLLGVATKKSRSRVRAVPEPPVSRKRGLSWVSRPAEAKAAAEADSDSGNPKKELPRGLWVDVGTRVEGFNCQAVPEVESVHNDEEAIAMASRLTQFFALLPELEFAQALQSLVVQASMCGLWRRGVLLPSNEDGQTRWLRNFSWPELFAFVHERLPIEMRFRLWRPLGMSWVGGAPELLAEALELGADPEALVLASVRRRRTVLDEWEAKKLPPAIGIPSDLATPRLLLPPADALAVEAQRRQELAALGVDIEASAGSSDARMDDVDVDSRPDMDGDERNYAGGTGPAADRTLVGPSRPAILFTNPLQAGRIEWFRRQVSFQLCVAYLETQLYAQGYSQRSNVQRVSAFRRRAGDKQPDDLVELLRPQLLEPAASFFPADFRHLQRLLDEPILPNDMGWILARDCADQPPKALLVQKLQTLLARHFQQAFHYQASTNLAMAVVDILATAWYQELLLAIWGYELAEKMMSNRGAMYKRSIPVRNALVALGDFNCPAAALREFPSCARRLRQILHTWRSQIRFMREDKALRQRTRKSKLAQVNDLITQAELSAPQGLQGLYRLSRKLAPKSSKKSIHFRNPDGSLMTDSEELASLTSYFRELYRADLRGHTAWQLQAPMNIGLDEVLDALRQMSSRKALPPNQAPAVFWTTAQQELAPRICSDLNCALEAGPLTFPDSWHAAYMLKGLGRSVFKLRAGTRESLLEGYADDFLVNWEVSSPRDFTNACQTSLAASFQNGRAPYGDEGEGRTPASTGGVRAVRPIHEGGDPGHQPAIDSGDQDPCKLNSPPTQEEMDVDRDKRTTAPPQLEPPSKWAKGEAKGEPRPEVAAPLASGKGPTGDQMGKAGLAPPARDHQNSSGSVLEAPTPNDPTSTADTKTSPGTSAPQALAKTNNQGSWGGWRGGNNRGWNSGQERSQNRSRRGTDDGRWGRDRHDRDRDREQEMEELREMIRHLARLALRLEDAMSICNLDNEFILFFQTGANPWSITTPLFTTATEWKAKKESNPESLSQPLRSVLFYCVWASLLTQLRKMEEPSEEEFINTVKGRGLTEDNSWLYLKWNNQTRKHEKDAQDPLEHVTAVQLVQQIMMLCTYPDTLGRFHALRPLTSNLSSDVIPFLLTLQNRTQESHQLYTCVRRLCRNSCTHLVGMALRWPALHGGVFLAGLFAGSVSPQKLVIAWRGQAATHAAVETPAIAVLQICRFSPEGGKDFTPVQLSTSVYLPIFTGSGLHTTSVRYSVAAVVYHLGHHPQSGHYRSALVEQGRLCYHTDDNVAAEAHSPELTDQACIFEMPMLSIALRNAIHSWKVSGSETSKRSKRRFKVAGSAFLPTVSAMGATTSAPTLEHAEKLRSGLEECCLHAASFLASADVLLFCNGAGWSADSGLAVYRDVAKVPAYRNRKLEYHDICKPHWLYKEPELFWGFWGQCFNDYRRTAPHIGYQIVRHWSDCLFRTSDSEESGGKLSWFHICRNLELLCL
ncbi:unnamed protein product [Symbiodinium microadriaticum]|nr:unnamed protein product [Symbiodinium microadriaticum]